MRGAVPRRAVLVGGPAAVGARLGPDGGLARTAARKGEPHSGTGVRSSGTALPSAVSATACRKGTAISVVAS